MSSRLPGWGDYLDSFHAQRPGITEDVLARCTNRNGASPYAWLTDRVEIVGRVLDLACGSGPTRALVAGSWTGVDRSVAELHCARQHGRTPLVRADMTGVPIRDCSVDVVLCSMALMLVEPSSVLGEIHRILVPSGQVRILLPSATPLTLSDRWRYLRLFVASRASIRFPPTPLRRHAAEALAAAGLLVESDRSERFTYPIDTHEDADLFVDSWYQPTKRLTDIEARPRNDGLPPRRAVGVPLRRIIAHKSDGRLPAG